MNDTYAAVEPTRADVDALTDATVVEFGAPWCPHCQNAQPLIATAFSKHPTLRHIKIEDGPGRRLGRSFKIKLWPTLVFMKNGREIDRLVRPQESAEIVRVMAAVHEAM
jgi:thioredoxin 1